MHPITIVRLDPVVIVTGLIVTLVGAGILAAIRWGYKRWEAEKEKEQASAAVTTEPPYPVRLICEDVDDYDPRSGHHEGFRIEIYNESDKPVTVKGFGLDLTMAGPAEWHRYRNVVSRQPISFPMRLEAYDGIEGYIDAEGLADEIWSEGQDQNWKATHAYVDLIGHGKRTIDPKTGEPVNTEST